MLGLGCVVAAGVTLAAFLGAPGGEGLSLEDRARALEGRLIAPCCFSQTVDHHHSPQAAKIQQELRDRLAEGWADARIEDFFVERYGERILAAPRPVGFGALAYLVPPAFVALGGLLVALWLRRHRADTDSGRPSGDRLGHLDPTRLAELREELARLV